MFHFTIRDLLLSTTIVALAVGWGVERQQNKRLKRDVAIVEIDAQQSRQVIKNLYDDLERMDQVLPHHGLTIVWSDRMRPSVKSSATGWPRVVADPGLPRTRTCPH
jgi:hypothetical protein